MDKVRTLVSSAVKLASCTSTKFTFKRKKIKKRKKVIKLWLYMRNSQRCGARWPLSGVPGLQREGAAVAGEAKQRPPLGGRRTGPEGPCKTSEGSASGRPPLHRQQGLPLRKENKQQDPPLSAVHRSERLWSCPPWPGQRRRRPCLPGQNAALEIG